MKLVKAAALFGAFWCFSSVACDSEEARAFDFWVGQWQVTTPDGKLAGENTITQDLGGCVLREHYATPTGYEGRSLNIYDSQRRLWHQTWVDNQGLLLQLNGQRQGNAMVLSGITKANDGEPLMHRITWTANQDGSVRQHWQTRKKESQQWQTAFDGLYQRINKP